MIEHLLVDSAVIGGGILADSVSTYFGIKACYYETQNSIREAMRKVDVSKELAKNAAFRVFHTLLLQGVPVKHLPIPLPLGIAPLFGLDFLIGIEDKLLNFHHVSMALTSGLNYLAAVSNTAKLLHLEGIHKAASFPIRSYIKAFGGERYNIPQ